MTVWIDTPAWPHRGTLFAHMVSDHSLEELHDVAERAGVHPRAFDRDHYDVAERLLGACLDAGAVPAHTRRLVRALRESGLRLTKAQAQRDRTARRERLLARWPLPDSGLANELLDSWSTRGRLYHDLRHLEKCLDSLDLLDTTDVLASLAVWFHDAVYEGRAGDDEEASAALAEQRLPDHLPPADVTEVARLVRLTAVHTLPARAASDHDAGWDRAAAVCDADLSILGAAPADYLRYCRDVRVEYADVPIADFRRGRQQVLKRFLGLERIFHTEVGRQRWEAPARANLTNEFERLDRSLH